MMNPQSYHSMALSTIISAVAGILITNVTLHTLLSHNNCNYLN